MEQISGKRNKKMSPVLIEVGSPTRTAECRGRQRNSRAYRRNNYVLPTYREKPMNYGANTRQRRYLNEDPTAPHLKYGLFSKAKTRSPLPIPPKLNSQSWCCPNRPSRIDRNSIDMNSKFRQKQVDGKQRKVRGSISSNDRLTANRRVRNKRTIGSELHSYTKGLDSPGNNIITETFRPQAKHDAPQLVFRSLDSNFAKELVISRSTHMDIKPKNLSPVPGVPRRH